MIALYLRYLALSASLGIHTHDTVRPYTDSVTILSADTLARMATFWQAFLKKPAAFRDSVLDKVSDDEGVSVSLGSKHMTVMAWIYDAPFLVRRYPSMAANFKKARLTPEQYQRHYIALLSAFWAISDGKGKDTPTPESVAGKNVAFVHAHVNELKALVASGMLQPFKVIPGEDNPQKP